MLFTELIFFPFLILVYSIFWFLRSRESLDGNSFSEIGSRRSTLFLLVSSWIFYGWFRPRDVFFLLFFILVAYFGQKVLAANRSPLSRRIQWVVLVTAALSPLLYFKYWPFIEATIDYFPFISAINNNIVPLALPLGISFTAFQVLGFLIDSYQKPAGETKPFLTTAFFISFFPHLVAGPILKGEDFFQQLKKNFGKIPLGSGVYLILWGAMKKNVLADQLGALIVDPVYTNLDSQSFVTSLLALYAYSFQIFFDFSGYTDIAVGIGRLFGVEFPKNFNVPYAADNPSEFWKRWHITLSSWFREYVYIPLGGNRGGEYKNTRNVVITMLLCALWHGANWTFILWGLCHAALLLFFRWSVFQNLYEGIAKPIRIFIYFSLTSLIWVFFRANSVNDAIRFFKNLFLPDDFLRSFTSDISLSLLMLLLGAVAHFVLEGRRETIAVAFDSKPLIMKLSFVFIGLLALFSIAELFEGTHAFIYFRF